MKASQEQANVLLSLFPQQDGEVLNLVPEVGADDICRYIRHRTPFVVRQAPLVNATRPSFSFEHLATLLGDKEIVVEHKHRWENRTQKTTVREYITNIDTTEYYWRQVKISDLGCEIPPFPVLHSRTDTIWFDHSWVGPCGTVQTFHQDNHDELIVNCNAFMQMHGTKYVALASPRDSTLFEADSIVRGYSRLSLVSPFDPQLRKAVTSLSHVVLQPGDFLFIPERWWHYLQSVTASVSISRWWFDNRIAETLYIAANPAAASSSVSLGSTDWQHDLTEFGGREVLVEFLSQFTVQQQHIMISCIIQRYGPLARFTG